MDDFESFCSSTSSTIKLPSASTSSSLSTPTRTVLCMDTLQYLQQLTSFFPGSVITSIPDCSEIDMQPSLYKCWFEMVAVSILGKLMKDTPQVAIFYQTDCKLEDSKGNIFEWLDKSFLLQQAALKTGCRLLFHKIALVKPVEGIAKRPSFSHVLCFTPHSTLAYKRDQVSFYPDVSNRGEVLWAKGMGTQATLMAVRFVRDVVGSSVIVDPFCGKGTVLAAANFVGLDAIGVELSSVRCSKSRKLQWTALFGGKQHMRSNDAE